MAAAFSGVVDVKNVLELLATTNVTVFIDSPEMREKALKSLAATKAISSFPDQVLAIIADFLACSFAINLRGKIVQTLDKLLEFHREN